MLKRPQGEGGVQRVGLGTKAVGPASTPFIYTHGLPNSFLWTVLLLALNGD